MKNSRFLSTIKDMWELHLRSRLLRILESYRIKNGKPLTREQWVNRAMCNGWVWFHHPILGTFSRISFKRKIEKAINPCIPSSEDFDSMSKEKKMSYYVTYNNAMDMSGKPVHAILEITDKGMDFIGTLGYEQELYNKYGNAIWLIGIILGFIVREIYDKIVSIPN